MFVVATRSFRYDDTIKESNVVENLSYSQEYIQNERATCLYEEKNLKMQLLSLSVSQYHLHLIHARRPPNYFGHHIIFKEIHANDAFAN